MIAVGIDVSKSKSTVAILDSCGTVLATPFNMAHTQLIAADQMYHSYHFEMYRL